MYEQPTLIQVGKAEEVIQGITLVGPDLDGTDYPVELSFAEDQEIG
jgi:hypothetical protein